MKSESFLRSFSACESASHCVTILQAQVEILNFEAARVSLARAPVNRAMPNPKNIPKFYSRKRIFLTGSTGFLGKVVLEKILRSLSSIDVIYVLIRSSKGKSARVRLMEDLLGSPIFERLHKNYGSRESFNEYALSKLLPIEGDMLAYEDGLGIKKEDLDLIQAHGGVDILFHCAATVNFTERIDRAVGLNILGTLKLLEMASRLWRVGVFVHVSTAYVNANRPSSSRIEEKIYPLEIDPYDLIRSVSGEKTEIELERITTKALGAYPNSYTLTKAITEVMIALRRKALGIPLHIVRPTIIGAAFREPFPGWIDSVSAVAAVFMAGGLGMLSVMPGNPRNIGDLIPVDLVANHLLCAAMESFGDDTKCLVSHSSSSTSNPANWRQHMMAFEHFRKFQSPNGSGPCNFKMIQSPQQFQLEWFFRYTLPSSAYRTVSEMIANAEHIRRSKRAARGVERARAVNMAFESFTRNEWFFINRTALNWAAEALNTFGEDAALKNPFNADPRIIAWRSYLENFAIGLRRTPLHEDIIAPTEKSIVHNEMSLTTDRLVKWDADHHRISFPGIIPDITWAYTHNRRPGYTKKGFFGRILGLTGWSEGVAHEAKYVPRKRLRSRDDTIELVLNSERVQSAIGAEVTRAPSDTETCQNRARAILVRMSADMNLVQVRYLAYALRKIWRRLYEGIRVDEAGLERLRALVAKGNAPLVLLPSHRSYVDFVVLSYVFFAYNLPLPHILAGEDFLGLGSLSAMMRSAGAFFIRREFSADPLYVAIFEEYLQRLLVDTHCLEFFLEGTRSRMGKTLPPKFGALRTTIEPFLDGRLEDICFVPISIDFERILEENLYSDEMLGKQKPRETLANLLKSAPLLMKANYGYLSLQFGEPLSMKKYLQANVVSETYRRQSEAHEMHSIKYDPVGNKVDRHGLARSLAYELLGRISASSVAMPTHLVASIFLQLRKGIKLSRLIEEAEWLREEILDRGGYVAMVEGVPRKHMAERAIQMLGHLVLEQRHEEFAINAQHPNAFKYSIALSLYRNKILYYFIPEALWACAVYAMGRQKGDACMGAPSLGAEEAIFYPVPVLLEHVTFLDKLLALEFVRDHTEAMTVGECNEAHCRVLHRMVTHGVFGFCLHSEGHTSKAICSETSTKGVQGRLQMSSASSESNIAKLLESSIQRSQEGQRLFEFLCRSLWPFIDGYYAVIKSFDILLPNKQLQFAALLEHAQSFSKSLLVGKQLEHLESCARNTLNNAIASFISLGVLSKVGCSDNHLLELADSYRTADALLELTGGIDFFRKIDMAFQVAGSVDDVNDVPFTGAHIPRSSM